ncbi:MAG: 4-hydroxy-tetrahydrodipicolinate reductase [Candidatus Binatia bacterium]|nr:4-hydroxy-tetrahydrodipicolinate reductase [Candidatus Binatia bacterium]
MTTELIVCGAAGRMGREIVRLLAQHRDVVLKGAIEAPHHALLGQDAGVTAGAPASGVAITSDLSRLITRDTVVVDFSSPEATLEHLRIAVNHQAPIVVGTTGFSAAQEAELERLAPQTRCLISSNMSLGVALLTKLVELGARALGDGFDVEILELHHRHKVDAPSGTALSLARVIAQAKGLSDTTFCYGREGRVGPRPRNQIGILAARGGDVVGDHIVLFAGNAERIELTHRAQSRECFARGAIRAAVWLKNQPNGRYTMRDVLGL